MDSNFILVIALFTLCLKPQCCKGAKIPSPWGPLLNMTLVTSGTLPPQQIRKYREALFYWLMQQKRIKLLKQWDCKPNPLNLIIANLYPVPVACRKFLPVVNWQSLLFMCLLVCTQHMFNGSSAPFFLLFFAVVLICFLQCMVVAAVTILSLPCKVCWPSCERPFCDGLWTLVLLSNAAFVWWCKEQRGNEFGGCVKFWLRAGGVEAIPFFEIAATSQHHLGNWKIFQLLQSQQSCCFCQQKGSSNVTWIF